MQETGAVNCQLLYENLAASITQFVPVLTAKFIHVLSRSALIRILYGQGTAFLPADLTLLASTHFM